jgi:hypothetical protein
VAASTVIVWVFDADKPRSFVTVSVTTNPAALVNACVTIGPEPVPPSPNVHE